MIPWTCVILSIFFMKEKYLLHLYKTTLASLTHNNGAGREIWA